MAIKYIDAPQDDRTLQLLGLMQGMSNSLGAWADQKNKALAGSALFGSPGADFGDLTKKHAPGLDPKLAGPALAMTQGGMAKPGLMNGGSWRDLSEQQRGAVTNMFTGGGFGGGFGGNMMQMALARTLMGGGR